MKINLRHPIAALWVYTLARAAVFGLLFGLLWLFGVRGLLGAAIALVLSVPLSYVLLTKPRAALTDSVHDRLDARHERTVALDAELAGDDLDESADEDANPGARPTEDHRD
jgi:hypothetical protein